jgi:selenide, water dikinase
LTWDDVPQLLSKAESGEDAGVYLLDERTALVQTVDFFPPIVNDPYTFGQIAAANALSDIYAMGAKPITTLNLIAFPCTLGLDVIASILAGGHDKVRESGAVMVGGHTIEDKEPKYGLAVTGLADPSEITTIEGAGPGDALVLTKPVGTGILATALKGKIISDSDMESAIESMSTLNDEAALLFSRFGVNACTDVTGFGLVGHLFEMVKAAGVGAEIWIKAVPLFDGTLEMGAMGMMPAGLYRNREYVEDAVRVDGSFDPVLLDCMYDPQTSGGLLGSVSRESAGELLNALRGGPCPDASVVGRVAEGEVKIAISEERKP